MGVAESAARLDVLATVSPTAVLASVVTFGTATLLAALAGLWRSARNSGEMHQWKDEVDRRLSRIERRLGFTEAERRE